MTLGAESLGKLDRLETKEFKTPSKVKDKSRRSCSNETILDMTEIHL